MTTAAIVLAGGAARRFGSDKLAATDRGRPVLHHALDAAGSVAGPVVLVLGPDAPVPPLPASVAGRVTVARDAVAHQGPLAGLAAGLATLPPGTGLAIVVAGDMPSLVPGVLAALAAALDAGGPAGMATLEAAPASPLPAAVRPAVVGPAAAALLAEGSRSLRALNGAVPSIVLPAASWRVLDPDGRTLRDVDTPADLGQG